VGKPSAADGEAAQAFRLLGEGLDLGDLGAARAVAAPAHDGPDGCGLALEHRLDRPVRAVPHPAGDAAGVGRPRERDAEAHALDEAVHDDAATDHAFRIAAAASRFSWPAPHDTRSGVGVVSFTPAPLWLIVPAVASLLLRSRLLTFAACLTLAGIVGNTISQTGSLDFGPSGSWSLADVYLADGPVAMAVALTWQLRAIVVLGPQRVRG
jgi:hypothetical protein